MELSLNCKLATRSAERLQVLRTGWLKDCSSIERENAAAPIEIIESCHLFLLSAGVISKILYGSQADSKDRACKLRKLMRLPELRHLVHRKVRNSFEHIDERLDRLSKKIKSSTFVSPLMVDDQSPDPTTIVLKRFCPSNMHICFEGDSVDVNGILNEIGVVTNGIANAYAALNISRTKFL